ncbi:DNA (cytosine-5-)-methyltransferase [Exiguobacterium sp. CinTr1]|uniref:DNA (cytosine-5-)-methyltransferase n=1 Tax=Exiguobacterium sp. CinTr1 TaxID=2995315 RepID=UPI0022E09DA1|nr:DNA (cytosine-5-)-methyltransferase [Exiguobacterium sp. CinTr1]
MRKLRYLDFFAGIGGFHSAFERVGWECVGFCEIDKFARQSYKAIHNVECAKEWHDITAVTDEEFASLHGQVDVIAGGFPCQAFSVAGKRGGFEDSRGTLFFEVARAAKAIKPKYLVLENVKGLLSHDSGNTVDVILRTLNELGYTVDFEVLNTKFFGVPQNRERIFIVAVRDDLVAQEAWDIKGTGIVAKAKKRFSGESGVKAFNFFGWVSAYDVVGAKLRDVLETEVDDKYYLSAERTANLIEKSASNPSITQVVAELNHYSQESLNRIYGVDGQAPTINTMQGGGREPKIAEPTVHATLTPDRAEKRQNGRRFKDNDEPMFTLTAQDKHGVLEVDSKIIDTKSPDNIRIYSDTCPTIMANDFKEPKKVIERNQHIEIVANLNHYPYKMSNEVYGVDGVTPALLTMQGGGQEPKVREPVSYRIRKLTPRECWRLQDFTDEQFAKARAAGVSDSQLYKQAGNSVTVKVVEVIAHNLAALDAQLR